MIPELKTLIAVCKYGTFASAGEQIGLTQSAVSSQIKRLEDALGFPLFDRTGRSATLNAAGQTTVERAEVICALFSKLGDPSDESVTQGVLRIGSIASAQPTLVARALEGLRRLFPLVRVHVSPGVSMRLMDDLDAGKIDAAVMIRPPFGMPSDMAWQALVHEPFVLVGPKEGTARKDWRTLIQERPFLRYDRASFGGRMVEGFLRRQGLAVNEAIELDEIPGLIHLASKGVGVAVVPLVEAHLPLPDGVRVISLQEHTFYREIGLLQRRAQTGSPVVAHFSRSLAEASQIGRVKAPAGTKAHIQASRRPKTP
ncbi:LysR family transcriptional regulator [Acidovorax sp. SUPP3434]|uniref:LysR family transcriptional regulator n=1 Tax=Acidovorax sp. SUPP3434 TaxID=2920880 RepID=UPI0023DE5B3A|nr:LysR family transcriptional regulator [Acidovorax sp. SUPP3434]GKS99998.1 LysR family transcriptional regulator [Acidovorax sp. SUPP3434]